MSFTFDWDVLAVAVFIPTAPVLHLTHVVSLVLQLDAGNGELQDPFVAGGLEGQFPTQKLGVLVQTVAFQLWRNGLRVQTVPAQVLVGVAICIALQPYQVLLQRILGGLHLYPKAIWDS